MSRLDADLAVNFLTRYYAVLENKPQSWMSMVDKLRTMDTIELLPL